MTRRRRIRRDFQGRLYPRDRTGEGLRKAQNLSRATTSASVTHRAPARSGQHQTKSGLSLSHAHSGARTLHLEKGESRFRYWVLRPPFGGPAQLCAFKGKAWHKVVIGIQREGALPNKQSMWRAGDQREGLVYICNGWFFCSLISAADSPWRKQEKCSTTTADTFEKQMFLKFYHLLENII